MCKKNAMQMYLHQQIFSHSIKLQCIDFWFSKDVLKKEEQKNYVYLYIYFFHFLTKEI